MATIYRFEDLPIWQLARAHCNGIFKITDASCLFEKGYRFRSQIKASAGSVMDNIVEGFERSSRLEFINFLSIAKGSAGEVRSQLYRAIDNEYIDRIEGIELVDKYEALSKEISGFISYLNKANVNGQKFVGRNKHNIANKRVEPEQ